jgi:hypothetical protein
MRSSQRKGKEELFAWGYDLGEYKNENKGRTHAEDEAI